MTATEVIKERLKELNMSQVELAEALGITRQNLANKLKRDNFTAQELYKISTILKFDIIFKTEHNKYTIEY